MAEVRGENYGIRPGFSCLYNHLGFRVQGGGGQRNPFRPTDRRPGLALGGAEGGRERGERGGEGRSGGGLFFFLEVEGELFFGMRRGEVFGGRGREGRGREGWTEREVSLGGKREQEKPQKRKKKREKNARKGPKRDLPAKKKRFGARIGPINSTTEISPFFLTLRFSPIFGRSQGDKERKRNTEKNIYIFKERKHYSKNDMKIRKMMITKKKKRPK